MEDSDLEAVADTFEDFTDEDHKTDTLDGGDDEIGSGKGRTDDEEYPEDPAEDATPEGEDGKAEDPDSDDQVRVTLDDGSIRNSVYLTEPMRFSDTVRHRSAQRTLWPDDCGLQPIPGRHGLPSRSCG
ncbi:hypothetical protein C8N32_1074 [Rhodovulum imhoffii]|uniref:Uncharacterized protein n=1 Tax=Rhodovulum imhoffii TaxID=365340 RepID=A0A2T5BSD6_9RHOB|nr:hypothetical protein [Rhodovulum imhoffii]PTN02238.1 hypothetical protein C8N32_1074 [Rhodovulum imhoffii]